MDLAPAPAYAETVLVVFSDLDGTLLDPARYDFNPARPALEALRQTGVPFVLVSSKTRAEMEHWRRRLGNRDPFVVENGGAIYVPQGYFPFALPGAVRREGYDVIELGKPYAELVKALDEAAAETETPVLGFYRMTVGQIRRRTALPLTLARLAKQREYDEPFEIRGTARPEPLLAALERRGLRWTRGGRFYHVLGDNDKAGAVDMLIGLYRRVQANLRVAGLGDARNDVSFLRLMNEAFVVLSPAAREIQDAVPGARITSAPGPRGWNEAVLSLLHASPRSEMVP
jgi:mannosyl-3-phosphoglycerate phosphatase